MRELLELSGVGSGSWDLGPALDTAAVIAVVTLVFGILSWTYQQWREWRRREYDRGRNGALRLLLKLLREASEDGQSEVPLKRLHEKFAAPELRDTRKAYCYDPNYAFEDEPDFEAAVYSLQWEGKVDFVSADSVAIRIARQINTGQVSWLDADQVLEAFRASLTDTEINELTVKALGRLAARVDLERTRQFLRVELSRSANGDERTRAVLLTIEDIERPY